VPELLENRAADSKGWRWATYHMLLTRLEGESAQTVDTCKWAYDNSYNRWGACLCLLPQRAGVPKAVCGLVSGLWAHGCVLKCPLSTASSQQPPAACCTATSSNQLRTPETCVHTTNMHNMHYCVLA
jgi:hypothetical protein